MCRLPDDRSIIAIDRPDDVGVPTLETAHCQWPQGAKVDHFMTRGIGVWQHACEAPVTCSEVVIVVRRDGAEASTLPGYSLTRTGTGKDENMKSLITGDGRDLVCHCADVEDIHVISAADHVIVAKLHQNLRRHLTLLPFPYQTSQVTPR